MDDAKVRVLGHVISDTVRRSKIAAHFHGVTFDDSELDEIEMYRVVLQVDPLTDATDSELADLVDAIRTAVEDLDPRLPSVRFLEAA